MELLCSFEFLVSSIAQKHWPNSTPRLTPRTRDYDEQEGLEFSIMKTGAYNIRVYVDTLSEVERPCHKLSVMLKIARPTATSLTFLSLIVAPWAIRILTASALPDVTAIISGVVPCSSAWQSGT